MLFSNKENSKSVIFLTKHIGDPDPLKIVNIIINSKLFYFHNRQRETLFKEVCG